MDSKYCIPPFYPESDRDAFGHWLSGFVDGEGCFWLGYNNYRGWKWPRVHFQIKLREDDKPILLKIQSYFQCGLIQFCKTKNPLHEFMFNVNAIKDHLKIIVPHFKRFPLRAKKANDFPIYEQAVRLIYKVTYEKRISRSNRGGTRSKWTLQRRAIFDDLLTRLRAGRKPSSTVFIPRPPSEELDWQCPLFDP